MKRLKSLQLSAINRSITCSYDSPRYYQAVILVRRRLSSCRAFERRDREGHYCLDSLKCSRAYSSISSDKTGDERLDTEVNGAEQNNPGAIRPLRSSNGIERTISRETLALRSSSLRNSLRGSHSSSQLFRQLQCLQPLKHLKPFSSQSSQPWSFNRNHGLEAAIASSGPQIFISKFHDPFLNLALEDYIFKHMPTNDNPCNNRLVLYINDPCVVIGRNQNPWRECNLPMVNSIKIPLVRRRSGGGAVVHDRGNMNFCVMTSREDFTRDRHAQMIVDSVNQVPDGLGYAYDLSLHRPIETFHDERITSIKGPSIPLKVNFRFDIVNNDDKKVSGSAYKIERQRAYHHGTMLVNSELKRLTGLLSHDESSLGIVRGKGVESVKSPVANTGMDIETFQSAIIGGFFDLYGGRNREISIPIHYIYAEGLPDEIYEKAKDLDTWKWIYGQTPDFTHELSNHDLNMKLIFSVSKGFITHVDIDILNPDGYRFDIEMFEPLIQASETVSLQYSGLNIAGLISNETVARWLQTSIDGLT